METISDSKTLQKTLKIWREKGASTGFVPTMGALHSGHLSLIEAAERSCDIVICSIFVNPLQFNEASDFEAYPRNLQRDLDLLKSVKCDIVFTPGAADIYPDKEQRQYQFGPLMEVFEGEFRPGHFDGMLAVVQRLLEITKPDKAFFGKKDFQQYLLVKALAKHLHLPTSIIGCPIVREDGGLAFSSRNQLLKPLDRERALNINRVLQQVKDSVLQGTAPALAAERAKAGLEAVQGITVEYLQVAAAEDLQPPRADTKDLVVLAAARVGNVRLIDNLEFQLPAVLNATSQL